MKPIRVCLHCAAVVTDDSTDRATHAGHAGHAIIDCDPGSVARDKTGRVIECQEVVVHRPTYRPPACGFCRVPTCKVCEGVTVVPR